MYITAVRPKMLRLGGEIGDGVLLSAGCAPGYIRQCAAEIGKGAERAGKSGRTEVAGFITTAVSNDPAAALDASKMFLAYIFRNTHHAENIKLGGAHVDQEGLALAVGKRDWDAAKSISVMGAARHSITGGGGLSETARCIHFGRSRSPDSPPHGTQEIEKGSRSKFSGSDRVRCGRGPLEGSFRMRAAKKISRNECKEAKKDKINQSRKSGTVRAFGAKNLC